MKRLLTHIFLGPTLLRRYFPPSELDRITGAIAAAERRHAAEIRFCVEGAFELGELIAKVSPRERAIEAFSELRLWDTAHNNGVLIYLLLADHDIEIVADRGISARVETAEWDGICRAMEDGFRGGRFADTVIAGINQVSTLLARHFPPSEVPRNELPNEPVVRP
ncbi:MAG: hypothetical protein RL417_566 [Pseudomonadota bacterium]|jgi:uncharacterized membrane protein